MLDKVKKLLKAFFQWQEARNPA